MYLYNLYKDGQLAGEKITAKQIGKLLNKSHQSVNAYIRGQRKPPEGYDIEFVAILRKTPLPKKAEDLPDDELETMSISDRYDRALAGHGKKFDRKMFEEWVVMNRRYGKKKNATGTGTVT